MAAPKNFRSAFNGFNREDVVHYIEYMNAQHTTQVNQLNSELEFLRQKLTHIQAEQPATDNRAQKLEEACNILREQLQEAQDRNAILEAQCKQLTQELDDSIAANSCSDLEAMCAQLTKERDEALAAKAEAEATKVHVSVEAELEAYRRAERVERLAHERVEQLYHQANGTLADAAIKVEDASNQINTLSDLVTAQLTQLQNAVTGSKQALHEATAGLYAIRPNTEEN